MSDNKWYGNLHCIPAGTHLGGYVVVTSGEGANISLGPGYAAAACVAPESPQQ